MRLHGLALCGLLLACGGDQSAVDAAPGAVDAKVGAPDAAAPDAVAPDASSVLGRLCATEAVDGGPGSCPGAICCNVGGTTVCTQIEDCAGGSGYVACEHTSGCAGGRVCCHVTSMQFCTKSDACKAYGGTEVP